ncbi:MAG: TlyA family rRNA (cytidine-2'-O)-methyltransferase [Anaerolinea sp.]|nr:TlyA family rRNA (cytidine-2'-O)-methyltransferase [Anaerolinea sp.]
MEKKRLDLIMEELGLAESRSAAQRIIMAGEVRVNGQVVLKSASKVNREDLIEVAKPPPYVSRGGDKLLRALEAFNLLDLKGFVCADIGSSTGGFTDCLLQHGAEKVFAVDVGYGVMHWKLRNHPKVVIMERTNARFVEGFGEPINLVTIDASFISLRTLLPTVKMWFAILPGEVVALIKPQFEAGRADAARGEGVIRDSLIHQRILEQVLSFAVSERFEIKGLIKSPLTGPKGNIEFLVYLKYPAIGESNLSELVNNLFPNQKNPEDNLNLG